MIAQELIAQERVRQVEAVAWQILPEREVPAAGLRLDLSWRPVLAATAAVVEAASLDLAPVPASHTGLSVPVTVRPSGNAVDILIDGPMRPVRTVTLSSLKASGFSAELRGEAELAALLAEAPGAPWRLCVALDQGAGFGMIQYAVPAIGARRAVPATLVGARYANRVLRLPDVPARALRLSLQRGNFPEDFTQHGATLSSASLRVAPGPVDLAVKDASGSFWQAAGPFTQRTTIDLKNSIERALNADPAGASAAVTLQGTTGGRLHVGDIVVSGHLLRTFEEKVQVALAGHAQPLPLGALEARAPGEARADVILSHKGLRLHPLSDAMPAGTGGLAGAVVGATPVARRLPPDAMRGERLARIGVVGFGDAGTLSLRVLQAEGARGGAARAHAHAAAPITPTRGAARPAITWIELAKPLAVEGSLEIELSSSERFLWVAGESGALVRFAVAAEPGGSVTVAGKSFAMTGPRTELLGESLPHAAFAGGPVVAASDQFCTVTLSGLRLSYAP